MGDLIDPLNRNHIMGVNRILTRTVLLFLLILWMGGVLIELAGTWI
jgi:adenosylcobinamide-phosphate synthase